MTEIKYRETMLNSLRSSKTDDNYGIKSYIADNFAKYSHPTELSRYLARYELFKMIVGVKGSIVECGIKNGAGLLQWWHLARMIDPNNFHRKIFGFDTFEGFPSVNEKDGPVPKEGDLGGGVEEEILRCIDLYAHYTSGPLLEVIMIKGDFLQTSDVFIENYPHAVFSLVFLDFDLYEPTKKALEVLIPRMVKGSILAFDEINNPAYPGETTALLETLGVRNLELKQFPFNMDVCYAVL